MAKKLGVLAMNLVLLLNGLILWAVTSITITGKSSIDPLPGVAAFFFYAITTIGANYLLFRMAGVKARKDAFTFSLFMVGGVAFLMAITHLM
ncbi:hypothetical protein EDM56_24320 [Brevibacillus fluminis]|uniref:Uncharacterized protein n=1 Tax=Brevibacillus fluminis TaxID=511487 RepID=A0A3M8D1N8_9BACL|nr:hypothetical protein [Brevibacillus fluminis]RNB81994.1 hypothetical protein EDM56_24320 [Brevibacillus fluminis]